MKARRFENLITATVLVFVALFLLSSYSNSSQQPKVQNQQGEINFVFDGDTFQVKTEENKLITVRIIGADSPEVQSKYENEECFGPQASKFAQDNFLGKKVEILSDSLSTDKDSYDRFLRYLKLENGKLISETLIENGYAKLYHPADYEQKEYFASLEARAKDSGLGLWAACQ